MLRRQVISTVVLAALAVPALVSLGYTWQNGKLRSGDVPSPPGAKCSTDKLVRKGEGNTLFGAIEVGSKGVKGKVIQELPEENEDGAKLVVFRQEKVEERNVTPVKPESKADTVEAVQGMFLEIQERFQIPCEQIVIYGSSGLAEKAPHKDELTQKIQEATGRSMRFITPEEEATFAFDGMVPSWRRDEVVLIDIGSGNTKGAFLNSKQEHETFSVPFGTITFTDEIKGRQGDMTFAKAAEDTKKEILNPKIVNEIQINPGMQNSPRIYLAGGISWALFTLTRPCQREFAAIEKRVERFDSFAPILPEDINTFYIKATRDKEALFKPDLSACSDERREEVKEEIEKIEKDIFSTENLIAGAEIIRAFNEEIGFDNKEIYFARSSQDAIPIGYLRQELKFASETDNN